MSVQHPTLTCLARRCSRSSQVEACPACRSCTSAETTGADAAFPKPAANLAIRHGEGASSDDTGMDAVRIDKWICAARFFKTRGVAAEAVLAGHVHLNGARVKPSKDVRVGDQVEIRSGTTQRTVLVVVGLSDKRGPAKVAQELYCGPTRRGSHASRRRCSGSSRRRRSAPTWARGRRSRTAGVSMRFGDRSVAVSRRS